MGIEELIAISTAEVIFGLTVTQFLVFVIAILILKGLALWKAARLKEQGWFWFIFIFNTMGILPAIYLYLRRNRKV